MIPTKQCAATNTRQPVPLADFRHATTVSDPVDFLSTEGLINYFGERIKRVRGDIQTLMARQQERSTRSNALQSDEAVLQQFAEKGVHPGDPGWDQFVAAANDLKRLLGDSDEGRKVAALVDKGLAGTPKEHAFETQGEAEAFVAAHPGSRWDLDVAGDGAETKYKVTINDGPAAGLDKSDVSSIAAQSKSMRDALNSDNSMDMIRMQDAVQRVSQMQTMCSNILRSLEDCAKTAIGNFR